MSVFGVGAGAQIFDAKPEDGEIGLGLPTMEEIEKFAKMVADLKRRNDEASVLDEGNSLQILIGEDPPPKPAPPIQTIPTVSDMKEISEALPAPAKPISSAASQPFEINMSLISNNRKREPVRIRGGRKPCAGPVVRNKKNEETKTAIEFKQPSREHKRSTQNNLPRIAPQIRVIDDVVTPVNQTGLLQRTQQSLQQGAGLLSEASNQRLPDLSAHLVAMNIDAHNDKWANVKTAPQIRVRPDDNITLRWHGNKTPEAASSLADLARKAAADTDSEQSDTSVSPASKSNPQQSYAAAKTQVAAEAPAPERENVAEFKEDEEASQTNKSRWPCFCS